MATDQTANTLTRTITAAGPGPNTEALRAAYLDLLKLCLCDLAGVSTSEVRWTGDKRWFTRQLTSDDQLVGRADGKDWTLNRLSMSGLRRLGDLQECVESLVRDGIERDLIEAGVWRGGAYFHPWLPACRRAVDDFRFEHDISDPIHQIDLNGGRGRWRRESEPEQPGAVDSLELRSVAAAATPPGKPPPRIPTDRELQLGVELKAAQAQLRTVEERLDRITSSPLAGTRAWIGGVRKARSDRRRFAPR